MMLSSCQPFFVVAACLFLGCNQGSGSAPADASAQATPDPKAAPQEKPVPPTADPAMDAITKFIAEQKIDTSAKNWKTKLPKPPKVEFDAKKTYYWKLETNRSEERRVGKECRL